MPGAVAVEGKRSGGTGIDVFFGERSNSRIPEEVSISY
jgi:hypothetical protein